jgi:LPPG:FO 2-phospho-L-lactate transferase
MRIVCLAGGVGGAKLADGLQRALGPGELTVIVNTGDDLERHSLAVWPDHDTVLYTLAGVADPIQGWGMAGESWTVMEQLAHLGAETWFRLGDRDIATHLFRTARLRDGCRPTEIALQLTAALGVAGAILPMADQPVRTRVRTDDGWLSFQDYFVRLHQEPEVREVAFEGVDRARVTPEVSAAFASAEVVVIAPSNPIVSIGPILAVPGMREAIAAARERGVPVVAVSGIVAGKALRGPADRMMAALGEEATALGVARRYAATGLLDVFVLDEQDRSLAGVVAGLGVEAVVADTIMTDEAARLRLARAVLAAAGARA